MVTRRDFLNGLAGTAMSVTPGASRISQAALAAVDREPRPDDDILSFVQRVAGRHDPTLYAQILGAASEFKEGDEAIGVAAESEETRLTARAMLARTRLGEIDRYAPHQDQLYQFAASAVDSTQSAKWSSRTVGELKSFLLTSSENDIKDVMTGLSSDVIGCVVKLMSNEELIRVGQTVFNPLPGSQIGARGYMGARVQPNSPTDNVDDIRWQVFDAFSYAVGDVLLGTNPVSSEADSVAAIERTLQDILQTFEITDVLPHCVLSHIDVQSKVESRWPGTTELWFQSIAGSDDSNATFDISVAKMKAYANTRMGAYGLYFETGQGADFTNGHSHGFDMVLHESRKYGFARALSREVDRATGPSRQPWVHLNDVAGFIGPEVFRSKEQLVRCCLEDIVMGKLHGLCLGLDVCSTLHMDVSLDDLDWCLEQIMPANPGYLMALPTKIDPMLGYLTTGYQDHVRIRERFGYRVNDRMWRFYQQLGVIDDRGQPTEHFGDPAWVYLQYRRLKGDDAPAQEVLEDARQQMEAVRARGLFLAEKQGANPWDPEPQLQQEVRRIYDDAKRSIWTELTPAFVQSLQGANAFATKSADRTDYILHPVTGEELPQTVEDDLTDLRRRHEGRYDVQIVVSDGLNALAIMDDGHLQPFLDRLRVQLRESGFRPAPDLVLFTSGRVRAGYRTGELLFGGLSGRRAILHVIGERPGTGHRTFSTYMTAPEGSIWGKAGTVDHNITRVVSGIATTALRPTEAADDVARILSDMAAADT